MNTTQQETKRDDHATHKLPLHQLLSDHNARLVITLKKGSPLAKYQIRT